MRHRDGHATRGFTMLLVIGVMAIATTVIAFNLKRLNYRAGVVQRQIEQYELHHEIQGVRDIVTLWLSNPAVRNDLTEYSGSEEPAHTVTMADGLTVRIFVRDGQGTLLANLANTEDVAQQEMMIQALSKLPADRPDLIRRSGPMTMSFYAMPAEVIEAIAPSPEIASAMINLQSDPEVTRANLSTKVLELGGEMAEFQRIRPLITFSSEVWGLDVVAFDPAAPEAEDQYRLYTVLAQVSGPLPVIYEWRPIEYEEFQRLRQHATGSAR
ncbi:MAG: hypothetical protein ACIAQF_01040 [Phycisphaerales bacterium JB065]